MPRGIFFTILKKKISDFFINNCSIFWIFSLSILKIFDGGSVEHVESNVELNPSSSSESDMEDDMSLANLVGRESR